MGLCTNNRPENPPLHFFYIVIINAKKNLLYENLEGVGGATTVAALKKGDTILCCVLKLASR